MENKTPSDTEKIDFLVKKIKHIELSTHIQTAIMIVGFFGILSVGALLSKVKKNLGK